MRESKKYLSKFCFSFGFLSWTPFGIDLIDSFSKLSKSGIFGIPRNLGLIADSILLLLGIGLFFVGWIILIKEEIKGENR